MSQPTVSDDLMPNNSPLAFQTPKEQIEEANTDKAESLKAMPVIKAELQRLEERVAFRDSIDSIEASVEDDPILHQKMMLVNKLVKAELQKEVINLKEIVDQYATM